MIKYVLSLILLIPFSSVQASEIQVAVAANFTSPMGEIIQAFTQDTGHKVVASYSSTGKLYAQIINGAPYEILLSADQDHPQRLIEKNKASKNSLFTYATGKLVLWSPTKGFVDAGGEVLKKSKFNHISLANPKLAPYGAAAKEVLTHMKLWDKLQDKMVLGENINQAYQFVGTRNAQLGFVAFSQIFIDGNPVGDFWLVPQELYTPIKQDAVLLEKGIKSEAAKKFLSFLKSDKAREIIKRFGYEF